MGPAGAPRRSHHDGYGVPVEVSLAPLQTDEGLLISWRCATSPSACGRAEAQRLRDEVIATVSHELRTPLASIIGYTELMADPDEQDLAAGPRRLLSVIERNAARERSWSTTADEAFLDADRLHRAPAGGPGRRGRRVADDQGAGSDRVRLTRPRPAA